MRVAASGHRGLVVPLLVALLPLLLAREGRGAEKRSVLLVSIDTLRADHLGCYGDRGAETPTLDGLADRGALFERAYSAAPLTQPAHASMLTGVEPYRHRLRRIDADRLDPRFETLAESFAGAGYETVGVIGAGVLDREFGFADGFFAFDAEGLSGLGWRDARAVTDAALACLPVASERPVFAWVHYFDPHFPYEPPPTVRAPRTPYDGEITNVDRELGRLLDGLRRRGWFADALVCVVADHGEGLGEHGEAGHGMLLAEATLRVPFLIESESVQEYGSVPPARIGGVVSTTSVAPTLLELAGVRGPAVDAPSLAPMVLGARGKSEGEVYSETWYPWYTFSAAPARGLTVRGERFVESSEPELFDLRADPGEATNLAPRRGARVAERKERIRKLSGEEFSVLGPETAATPSEAAASKLRGLGYLAGAALPASAGPVKIAGLPNPRTRAGIASLVMHDSFLLLREGKWSELAEVSTRVLRQDRTNVYAAANLGTARLRLGDAAGALEVFRSVESRFHSADVAAGLGLALARLGRAAEALPYLGAAVAAQPWRVELVPALVMSRLRSGDPDGARRALAEARARGLSGAWVEFHEGILALSGGRADEAERAFEAAIRLDPSHDQSLANLASLRMRQGRMEDAAELMRRAGAANPKEPGYRRALIDAFGRLGRIAERDAAMRAYVEELPDAPGAEEYRKLLGATKR